MTKELKQRWEIQVIVANPSNLLTISSDDGENEHTSENELVRFDNIVDTKDGINTILDNAIVGSSSGYFKVVFPASYEIASFIIPRENMIHLTLLREKRRLNKKRIVEEAENIINS